MQLLSILPKSSKLVIFRGEGLDVTFKFKTFHKLHQLVNIRRPHVCAHTNMSPHDCSHTRFWQDTFVPSHSCALTRLCPDTFVPTHVSAHTHLCKDMLFIIVWSQSCLGRNVYVCNQARLCPLMFVLRHIKCAHTHLCPNMLFIIVWSQSCLGRNVYVCAQTHIWCPDML